jgi:hypothetical protein
MWISASKRPSLSTSSAGVDLCGGRMRSGPTAEADRGDMTRRAPSVARAFTGRWRITEMYEWDEIDRPIGAHYLQWQGLR